MFRTERICIFVPSATMMSVTSAAPTAGDAMNRFAGAVPSNVKSAKSRSVKAVLAHVTNADACAVRDVWKMDCVLTVKKNKNRRIKKMKTSRKTKDNQITKVKSKSKLKQSKESKSDSQDKQKKESQEKELALRFSPTAWAKLLYFRDKSDNEVGGFGITESDDLLFVTDFQIVKQKVTGVSVSFDDNAVADFFDRQVDIGKKPEQFARIWCPIESSDSASGRLCSY